MVDLLSEKELVGIPTNRGIKEYSEAFGMTTEEFLSWLSRKRRVLDIGSGGGRLAKEIELLKHQGKFSADTQIVSFDIAYAQKRGRQETQTATNIAIASANQTPTPQLTNQLNANFWEHAIAGSFSALPFEDKSFDGILANHSFGIHAITKQKLLVAFSEIGRVLEGDGYITVVPSGNPGELFIKDKTKHPIFYNLEEINFLNPQLGSSTMQVLGENMPVNFLRVSA